MTKLIVERGTLKGDAVIESLVVKVSALDCVNAKVNATLRVSGSKRLESLKGCPRIIGELDAKNCALRKLDCAHASIVILDVSDNADLRSLTGAPRRALTLRAARCDLTELDCANLSLHTLTILDNKRLTSLKGCPQVVEHLSADGCPIEALECPNTQIGVLRVNSPDLDLRDCPRIRELRSGALPKASLLWASGRIENVTLIDTAFDVGTLFRFKHALRTRGFHKQATLG